MNSVEANYTILVNSSDNFEDCWIPFFNLFTFYWPNCESSILLNTEHKNFIFDNLKIQASKVAENSIEKLTWSECLIKALYQIKTPLVLYLQEDYFLERKVDVQLINNFAEEMIANPDIKYIGLTNIGNFPPFKKYDENPKLVKVGNTKYRISTQAALWNRESLLSYIRSDENGWMFEVFGTQRAKRKKELFLTVNRVLYNSQLDNDIIRYKHTGIIKGKWHPAIPNLFKQHSINIDFSVRGFYKEVPYIIRKIETGRKLLKSPFKLLFGLLGK